MKHDDQLDIAERFYVEIIESGVPEDAFCFGIEPEDDRYGFSEYIYISLEQADALAACLRAKVDAVRADQGGK